jgi:hypothetical protein
MIKIIPDREGVITQWDLNRKVLISGIDNDEAGIKVHFASPNDDHNAYVVSPVINNNIVSATIPNILLTIPGRIYVYVYTSYTQDKAIVAVAPREKPDDYVYTETEKFALEQWEKEATERLEGRYDKAVQEIDERYAGLRDDAITAASAAASAQTSAAAADLSATRAEAAETNAKENAKAISEVGDQVTANAKAVSDALITVETAKSDALAAKSAAEAANEKAASSANAAKESQTAAETAESNAAEAAKAAQQAETSATEAKDNAITAKDDAENAKDIAETAKDDAIAAKNAAEQAKTAAETAAENVPIIDDTLAAGNRTWSSLNIVEKLCPPLTGSGNPVVVSDCIKGYPMKITASWEPTQAGSGDPSPENIRAISGRESIAFDRCGANLLDVPKTLQITGVLTISKKLPPGPYKLSWGEATKGGKKPIAFVCSTRKTAPTAINFTSANSDVSFTLSESIETIYIYSNGYDFSGSAGITSVVCDLMLSADKSATYAPYSGTTRNLTLPETIYGGSVDAATGEGMMTWSLITLDGTEDGWYKYGGADTDAKTSCFTIGISDKAYGFGSSICNLFCNTNDDSSYTSDRMKAYNYTDHPNLPNVYMNFGVDRTVTVDDWKSYLAAQYAAGKPVQVAYKLADPVPITAAGGSPLYQLDGINTVISDADTLTVNGRADPIKVMESQRQAIISLGGNI